MAAEDDDDTPELLVKLRERKERHKQRSIFHRAAIVVAGILIVIVGGIMAAPGVPGPGIAVILVGLTFLALEFDRAEQTVARVIMWGGRAAERAERTTKGERIAAGLATAAAIGAVAVAAVLWDIPLVPVL